jgi:uncharacterized membrane protein YqgA involved in biofilm formation
MPTTTGACLNAIGILLGALIGLARETPFSLRTQLLFRNGIGAFNFFFGVRLVYLSIGGTFLHCLKETFTAMLAVVLGFWMGKLFRFQKMSNYLGRLAGNAIVAAQKTPGQNASDGFNACAILFCAAPLGLIGAVTDGLSDYFYLLAVKAVMDALAMTGFVRLFRWPSALSAVPVFVFFSAISMAVQIYVVPNLSPAGLNSVNAAAGLLACIVTIVIFEVRKVPLANYLPALAIAPLLTKLFN